MPRIKKRGLDYFPIDIDFMHDRQVRRIMKAEGDAAVTILLQVYCSIYAGEGYYVKVDDFFYEDQADNLHEKTPLDVRNVVEHALQLGLFSSCLFQEYGILTSASIQRQFLFATKRRSTSLIAPHYCLISSEELNSELAGGKGKRKSSDIHSLKSGSETLAMEAEIPADEAEVSAVEAEASVKKIALEVGSVPFIHGMGTFSAENSGIAYLGTHSIAENSIAEQSIENSLLHSSPVGETIEKGDEEGGNAENFLVKRVPGNGAASAGKNIAGKGGHIDKASCAGNASCTDKASYIAKIAALKPPQDGMKRNYDGLLHNMSLFPIPPDEQYAIILKSNFGAIGHPVWIGFYDLRSSHGKIRLPGRYLLSLCR